jgi:hypothetical protein
MCNVPKNESFFGVYNQHGFYLDHCGDSFKGKCRRKYLALHSTFRSQISIEKIIETFSWLNCYFALQHHNIACRALEESQDYYCSILIIEQLEVGTSALTSHVPGYSIADLDDLAFPELEEKVFPDPKVPSLTGKDRMYVKPQDYCDETYGGCHGKLNL